MNETVREKLLIAKQSKRATCIENFQIREYYVKWRKEKPRNSRYSWFEQENN
jgi:hypothetical protein